jgi:hypothetical protein
MVSDEITKYTILILKFLVHSHKLKVSLTGFFDIQR